MYASSADPESLLPKITTEPKQSSSRFEHVLTSRLLCEFLGTLWLTLTIGFCVINGTPSAAMAIGSMLMVLVYAFGSVSGGHLNPAVTFSIWLSRRDKISSKDALFYMISQFLGATIGALFYFWAFQTTRGIDNQFGYTKFQATLNEVIFTSCLCYVVLNVATTDKQAGNHYFGLAIGFVVTSAAIAIGGISSCALNPAVAWAIKLIHSFRVGFSWSQFGSGMLYFLSGFCGGLIGAIGFYFARGGDEYKK